jgi:hypothetical protein
MQCGIYFLHNVNCFYTVDNTVRMFFIDIEHCINEHYAFKNQLQIASASVGMYMYIFAVFQHIFFISCETQNVNPPVFFFV